VDSLAVDWAAWDDTYQFVQNPNPEYIQTNLLPDTYMLNNLNLIALVRSDGTVVYAKLFDEKRGKLSDPHPEILKHLKRGGKLVSHKSVNSCIRGIVSTPEGASCHCLKTHNHKLAQRPHTRRFGNGAVSRCTDCSAHTQKNIHGC
jgi:sensor domain CHASE-containing protein